MIDDDRNVFKRIVTGDEIRCFMYDLGAKPKAQKMRMQKSRVKTMFTARIYAEKAECKR
jgi:hypothetical protein